MFLDWVKIQEKSKTRLVLLEKAGKIRFYEAVNMKPASLKTDWMEETSATYHVLDGNKWVMASVNYKMAYEVYENLVKS